MLSICSIVSRLVIPIILVGILNPIIGAGQECTEYSGYIRWVRSDPERGPTSGPKIDGRYMYLPEGRGLTIVDISQPTKLEVVSHIDVSDSHPSWVDVSYDYAFIIEYYKLHIVDVSSPGEPEFVSTIDITGLARGIDVEGSYAFIASDAGIQTVDISDPENPLVVGACDTAGRAWNVVVRGVHAFVPAAESGLQIVDVSAPASPRLIGSLSTPRFASSVALLGDLAFVGDYYDLGVHIVDISCPESPIHLSMVSTESNVSCVTVTDKLLLSLDMAQLKVYDLTIPTSPVKIGAVRVTYQPKGVIASDHYAYTDNFSSGIDIFDLRFTDAIEPHSNHILPSWTEDVLVIEDLVYVTVERGDNFRIYRMVDSDRIEFLGGVDLSYNYSGPIAVHGDYAYVANWGYYDEKGIAVLDISQPSHPREVRTVGYGDYHIRDLVVRDGYLYVVGGSGVVAYSVTRADDPQRIGAFERSSQNEAWRIAIGGDYFFVCRRYGPIQVVDFSDPTQPSYVRDVEWSAGSLDVQVVGSVLYAARGELGLKVYDISNPEAPLKIGGWRQDGVALFDLAVGGDVVYAACNRRGMLVYDVSAPAQPVLEGAVELDGFITEVFIRDDGVIAKYGRTGLAGFPLQCTDDIVSLDRVDVEVDLVPSCEVDSPDSPRRLSETLSVVFFSRAGFDANTIDHYSICGDGGSVDFSNRDHKNRSRHVVDVNQDGSMDLVVGLPVAELEIGPETRRLVLRGRTFGGKEIRGILEIGDCWHWGMSGLAIESTEVSPNPFNPQTTITFTANEPARVRVSVFDVRGRLISRIVDGEFGIGSHSVSWDGFDDRGHAAASGTYFFQVDGGGKKHFVKGTLVR